MGRDEVYELEPRDAIVKALDPNTEPEPDYPRRSRP